MVRCVSVFWLCVGLNAILVWNLVNTLTGHVCRRQKEETYRVNTNRAFLCSERYTTSCGHLDWRRCTRYRVQTCYTPSERYAKRFREVEECCPGWLEAAGSCSIPVCHGLCQNGGVCSQSGAVPHCSCLPGFHGDFCQWAQNKPIVTPPSPVAPENSSVPAWLVPAVVATAVLGVAVFGLIAFGLLRRSFSPADQRRVSPITVAVTESSRSSQVSSDSPTRRARLTSLPGTPPSAPSYEESTRMDR